MRKLALLTLMLIVSLGANAEKRETRYFLDGMFGEADQKNTINGFDAISGSDSSKGVRFGFYLRGNFGVEFIRMDYGQAEDSFFDSLGDLQTNILDTKATGVGLVGGIRLSPQIVLTGRLGLAAWDLDFKNTNSFFPGDVFRQSDEGVDAYVGLGLRFDIEDNVRIALEYETLDFNAALSAVDTDQTIQNIGISLGVLF